MVTVREAAQEELRQVVVALRLSLKGAVVTRLDHPREHLEDRRSAQRLGNVIELTHLANVASGLGSFDARAEELQTPKKRRALTAAEKIAAVATRYRKVEPAGLEPATSAMPRRRSPN